MLVTIISAVHSLRTEWIEKYFTSKGYEVKNMTLDMNSVHSLFGKIELSKSIRKTLLSMNPDIIYCEALFDFLMKELIVLKKKNNNTKLIFDVYQNMGTCYSKYLNQADVLLCDNEMYRGYIHGATLLYPTNGQECILTVPEIKENELSFCLNGNKNIDANLITSFLKECSISKKCTLHVYGNWRQKESFIQNVLSVGVSVIDYKKLDSQASRQEVFDQCHYGLNIMDFEGVNLESLDYMCGQIPIINSVNGDLNHFCELWDVGKNIDTQNYKIVASKICAENLTAQLKQREHMRNLYNTYFTKKKFFETLDKIGGKL